METTGLEDDAALRTGLMVAANRQSDQWTRSKPTSGVDKCHKQTRTAETASLFTTSSHEREKQRRQVKAERLGGSVSVAMRTAPLARKRVPGIDPAIGIGTFAVAMHVRSQRTGNCPDSPICALASSSDPVLPQQVLAI